MAARFVKSAFAVTKVVAARLRFLAVFAAAALVVGYWDTIQNYWDKWTRPPVAPDLLAQVSDIEYYCVMHPTVVRSEPGDCPICGMPLAKRKKGEKAELPGGVVARVQLTPKRIALAGIQTSEVVEKELGRDVRAAATLDYDETRVAQLSARVAGRADELFVKSVGQQVKAGDPLYSLYSPEVYTAQREYLQARKRVRDLSKEAGDELRHDAIQVYNATMQKLVLWGATNADLERLDKAFDTNGHVPTHFAVSSPIAGVVVRKTLFEGGYVQAGDVPYTIADLTNLWLQVRIYEQDVPLVKVGQEVKVTVAGAAHETFTGKITFLAYSLDPVTRTLAARVEVENPGMRLRPGMFADAALRVGVGPVERTVASTPPAAAPGAVHNAQAFAAALNPYLEAQGRLAQDRTDGVMMSLHDVLDALGGVKGEAAMHVEKIKPLVHGTMASKDDLEKLRTAFRDISAEMIALGAETGTLAEGPQVRVFRCPMDDKPNWMQLAAETANPYQGQKMATCGAQIDTLRKLKPTVATMAAGGGRVTAIPRSAAIITGEGAVVFAANPTMDGVFDMKPVKLGPLATTSEGAEEYYPVAEGLAPGDRVVTVGGFLLDAENRLNGGGSYTRVAGDGAAPAQAPSHPH